MRLCATNVYLINESGLLVSSPANPRGDMKVTATITTQHESNRGPWAHYPAAQQSLAGGTDEGTNPSAPGLVAVTLPTQ